MKRRLLSSVIVSIFFLNLTYSQEKNEKDSSNIGKELKGSEAIWHLTLDSVINDQLNIKFSEYLEEMAKRDSLNMVGTLKVNNDTIEYLPMDNRETKNRNKAKDSIFSYSSEKKELLINIVQIKFEGEQIIDVKVIGNEAHTGDTLIFQNRVPISYSTKADIANDEKVIGKIYLYDYRKLVKIKMHDAFTNDYNLLNNTENYSPQNTVIMLKRGEKGKPIRKDNVTNLFLAQVYSDLLGLNSSHPNGLIQTEISKRIYLNRRVRKWGNKGAYWGLVNSVNPHITLSKIEENNKFLIPEYTDNRLNVNIIDLFKYTSWQTGGEINFCYLGWPRMHSIFYTNIGFYFMCIPFRLPELEEGKNFNPFNDIIINEDDNTFNSNMITIFPEINWIIRPHSNLSVSYQAKWNILWNTSKDICIDGGKSVLSLRFTASIKLNNKADGQVFFRSYYNFSPEYPAQNFLQTQVGYSFNIFENKNIVRDNTK